MNLDKVIEKRFVANAQYNVNALAKLAKIMHLNQHCSNAKINIGISIS